MSKFSFEKIRSLWSDRARNDTIDIRKKDRHWHDFEQKTLEQFIERYPVENVLDVGSGTGRMTEWLVQHVASVVACDYSEECVRVTKERVPQADVSLQDVRQLTYANDLFSGVVAIRVLQSIPERADKIQAIKELHRILKPDGGLLLIEGNPNRLTDAPSHNYYSSFEDWQSVLETAGFQLEDVASIPLATVLAEIDKRNGWKLRQTYDYIYDIIYALDRLVGKYEPGLISHQFSLICTKK